MYKRNAGNASYKVVPKLSISNRELRERVKNRSIVVDASGQIYTADKDISKAARGSEITNARDYVANAGKLAETRRAIERSKEASKLNKAREEGRKSAEAEKGGKND